MIIKGILDLNNYFFYCFLFAYLRRDDQVKVVRVSS